MKERLVSRYVRAASRQIYGVDVGYGQLADKVRRDPRVVVIERFNLRYLKPEDLGCKVDIACLDLSFISVLKVRGLVQSDQHARVLDLPSSLKVMPAVSSVLKPGAGAELVVLIKPQFEAGREQVGSGGLVRDPQVQIVSFVHLLLVLMSFRGRCTLK